MQVYRVTSDNFEGQLMTAEAYHLIRLQMSTGDFHAHKARPIKLTSIRSGEAVLHFYNDDYKQRVKAGFTPEEAEELSFETVYKAQVKRWSDVAPPKGEYPKLRLVVG